jgi:hypothetical protein
MSLMHVTHMRQMSSGSTLFSATEETTFDIMSLEGRTAAAPRIFLSSSRQRDFAREMAGEASLNFSEDVELYLT